MDSKNDAVKKIMNDWTTKMASKLDVIEDTISVKPIAATAYGWGIEGYNWYADGSSCLITNIDNGTGGWARQQAFGDLKFISTVVIRRVRNNTNRSKVDQYLFIRPIASIGTSGSFDIPDFMQKTFTEEYRLPHGKDVWHFTDPVKIADLLADHEDEFIEKWQLAVSTLRRTCFELDKTVKDVYYHTGVSLERGAN